jgi:sugar lactone lactonase YvrE
MDQPQVVLTGLGFAESPRWHKNRLLVADWATGEIVAVTPGGESEVVVRVGFPSVPLSFDVAGDGETLLVVNSGEVLLVRQSPGGTFSTYADLSGLAAGLNEIVVDGRGNAYVNGGGIIALVAPDGATVRVADEIVFGNGMAVTQDNATLIVAESHAYRLTAFDIAADGTLGGRRVWADLGDGVPPDGICLDGEGTVWFADVPGRRCVRVAEGGEVLDVVGADRGCFACVLGGEDRQTLYIVGQEWKGMEGMGDGSTTGQVLAVRAPAPGVGWP